MESGDLFESKTLSVESASVFLWTVDVSYFGEWKAHYLENIVLFL